ncbi:hypothetical protein ACI792_04105 [Blastococcus sp. SYSU DS0669]
MRIFKSMKARKPIVRITTIEGKRNVTVQQSPRKYGEDRARLVSPATKVGKSRATA